MPLGLFKAAGPSGVNIMICNICPSQKFEEHPLEEEFTEHPVWESGQPLKGWGGPAYWYRKDKHLTAPPRAAASTHIWIDKSLGN